MPAVIPVAPAGSAPEISIKVVGVGGAGGNVVDRMVGERLAAVDALVLNTDSQALRGNRVARRLIIGETTTHGLGAGGDPGMGQLAAEESTAAIQESLRGAHMVFIAAGMGGGTGTGAAPIVASVARELGALTVALVTRPFGFEGRRRAAIAEQGIAQLRSIADTVVIIPNDRLVEQSNRGTGFVEAFARADTVLRAGVQGLADLIAQRGLINVDFADVRAVMGEAGPALLGIGVAQGTDRVAEATRRAMACPLLEGRLDGARRLIYNITGGEDLGMLEVDAAAQLIAQTVDPDANMIVGATIDPALKAGYVKVTLVATGFREGPAARKAPEPARQPITIERPRPAAAGATLAQAAEPLRPAPAPAPARSAVAPALESLDMPPFLLRRRQAR